MASRKEPRGNTSPPFHGFENNIDLESSSHTVRKLRSHIENNFVLTESLRASDSQTSLTWDPAGEELSNTTAWSIDTQFDVPALSTESAGHDKSSSSSGSSTQTVAPRPANTEHTMPGSPSIEDKVNHYRRSIDRCVVGVEDDIVPFLNQRLSSDGLRRRQDLATSYKVALQDAHLFLQECDPQFYPKQIRDKITWSRQQIVAFLLYVEQCLEQEESTRAAEKTHSQNTLSQRQDVLKEKAIYMIKELEKSSILVTRVLECRPESDGELFELASKHKHAEENASSTVRSASETARLVLDHNLFNEYKEIEVLTARLKDARIAANEHVEKERKRIGIWESSAGSRSKVSTPMPTFAGLQDQNSTIYEFEEAWIKYKKSCSLSNIEAVDHLKIAVKASKADVQRLMSENDIFQELKVQFGNPLILLKKKESEVKALDLCKGNDMARREWLIHAKSLLEGLQDLCAKHRIEDYLYRSSVAADLQGKLPYEMCKDFRRQLKKHLTAAGVLPLDVIVEELVLFLDDKITDCTLNINLDLAHGSSSKFEAKSGEKSKPSEKTSNPKYASSSEPYQRNTRKQGFVVEKSKDLTCVHCSGTHDFLFYCPKYIEAKVSDRFSMALKQQICVRCLNMKERFAGKKSTWWDDHKDNCATTFHCKRDTCGTRDANRQYHVTLCAKHANDNKKVEAALIRNLDPDQLPVGMDIKDVKFFHMTTLLQDQRPVQPCETYYTADGVQVLPDLPDNAIFMMQTIPSNQPGKDLLVFYDTGCSSASLSNYAFGVLDTKTVREGPTILDVASGQSVQIPYGDEQFQLDLDGGKQKATITGLRMSQITSHFPVISLHDAWADCMRQVPAAQRSSFPRIDSKIGGREVDVLLGIRYLKYFPELILTLPSGLSIYKARLGSASGCQAVLGGPHGAWDTAVEKSQYMNPRMYLSMEARVFCVEQAWVRINQQRSLLFSDCCQDTDEEEVCGQLCCCSEDGGQLLHASIIQEERHLWKTENLGTESTFRCIKCRDCSSCREGEVLEMVSLREEREQALIEESVIFYPDENRVVAALPFIDDPTIALKENRHIAEKVFRSQLALFEKNPDMRSDVIKSHQKLQDRGFVFCEDQLPKDKRELIESGEGSGYFIPWRVVYNEGSLSTPCRLVFDASSKTPGGDSLNGILAKGVNRLVKLQDLLVRFRRGQEALTADISMAYNGTWLKESHLRYQRYLWKKDLNPHAPTKVMYVATLIYGVKSSGQQCQVSLERLADFFMSDGSSCVAGAKVLKADVYVDDIISSCESQDDCKAVAQDISTILGKGSMKVKGFTFSGQDPSVDVSGDGESVGLAGYLWFPREDLIALSIGLPRLGKAKRGKRPQPVKGSFVEALRPVFTRRTVTGIVAGVFDPLGLVTPVTASMKLSLHDLCLLKLGWDDPIPEHLLPVWASIMAQVQELRHVTFRRTVIPEDAKELRVDFLIAVDASQDLGMIAVYGRVPRRDGSYSCQLLMGRSKILTGLTVPRAELKSAVIGAISALVARRNMGKYAGEAIFVSDSTVSLHWISQDDRPLQTGVRNAVLEIRRLSNVDQWFHVESSLNIADKGTRGAKVEEVMAGSPWQVGMAWMRLVKEEMPIQTVQEMVLSAEEKRQAAAEMRSKDIRGHAYPSLRSHVSDRYSFSNYLVDPCRFSWSKSVRIMSLVLKFVCSLQKKSIAPPDTESGHVFVYTVGSGVLGLSQSELMVGEKYFFRKATKEVLQFSKKKDYDTISSMEGEILLFQGRILGTQDVKAYAEVMFDLSPVTFCRPIVDRYSPVAYSIMTEVHWQNASHLSVARTWRESLCKVFVLHGRSLAKEVRDLCAFCCRFKARLTQVEMAPIHETRLAIAPPFYYCQVDLLGPFHAQCEHNHRAVVKVWGIIFKDPASGAVFVHAMSKYNTSQFVMAYTRFAARFGHPRRLFPDEGSQLVSGCKNMEFSWLEVNRTLGAKHGVGVEFVPCPVGGHNAHGVVERSIREVRNLFGTVYKNCKLDILGYETAFSWISNELNNLPICLGSNFQDLDRLDLLTPNRLIQGKNNSRALSGCCTVPKPSLMLERMNSVFEAWWKAWYEEKLADYVARPRKWHVSDPLIKEGDIVVFLKTGNEQVLGEPIWRIGRVCHVEVSKDGRVRTVEIEYRNKSETVFRKTRRAARTVAVLFNEDDLDLAQELNAAARGVEADVAAVGCKLGQQVAVARELNHCSYCCQPNLCQRHLQFFSANPWLEVRAEEEEEEENGSSQGLDPLASGTACGQGLCEFLGLHDDPWEVHVVPLSVGECKN